MFVKNSFEYDARVTKEAKSLIALGHRVTVVALHVPGVTSEMETTSDGIHVIRVPRVEFGLGKISRVATRAARNAAIRESQISGKPIDEENVRNLSAIHPPSTATPGQDQENIPPEPLPTAPRSPFLARLRNRLTMMGIGAARLGFRGLRKIAGVQGRAIKTWAINRRMIAVGKSSDANVFHSHDLNTLWVGHRCKKAVGGKLVYDSHELATERNRMGFWWRRWCIWNEKRWLPSADAMIVASPSWIEFNRERYGRVPDLSVTVLNVPEKTQVSPKDLKAPVGLAPDMPILLYQGSIQENRGIEPAIEAISLLNGIGLVIVGYGHHIPSLKDMVSRQGLADRVKFFGPIPNKELIDYTASADIGLCNIVSSSHSYHTSVPNKLFEYLAAGIPVIGSLGPEIARIVLETGAGEVCEATDPEQIASAVEKILSAPEPYREAARAASEHHRWDIEAEKLAEVYNTLDSP